MFEVVLRMVDFVLWVVFCEEVFWLVGVFMFVYVKNCEDIMDYVIDGDLVVLFICYLMQYGNEWKGIVIEFFKRLNDDKVVDELFFGLLFKFFNVFLGKLWCIVLFLRFKGVDVVFVKEGKF